MRTYRIISIFLAALLVTACSLESTSLIPTSSAKALSEKILGDWYEEDGTSPKLSFYDDGTAVADGQYVEWNIVNGTLLKLVDSFGRVETGTIEEITDTELHLSDRDSESVFYRVGVYSEKDGGSIGKNNVASDAIEVFSGDGDGNAKSSSNDQNAGFVFDYLQAQADLNKTYLRATSYRAEMDLSGESVEDIAENLQFEQFAVYEYNYLGDDIFHGFVQPNDQTGIIEVHGYRSFNNEYYYDGKFPRRSIRCVEKSTGYGETGTVKYYIYDYYKDFFSVSELSELDWDSVPLITKEFNYNLLPFGVSTYDSSGGIRQKGAYDYSKSDRFSTQKMIDLFSNSVIDRGTSSAYFFDSSGKMLYKAIVENESSEDYLSIVVHTYDYFEVPTDPINDDYHTAKGLPEEDREEVNALVTFLLNERESGQK